MGLREGGVRASQTYHGELTVGNQIKNQIQNRLQMLLVISLSSGSGAIKERWSHFWSQSHFYSIYSFTESEIEIKSESVSLLWPRSLLLLAALYFFSS